MKIKKTFIAKICLGFREGYTQKIHELKEVYDVCHEYCDKVGLHITITPTMFIYPKGGGIKDGEEPGVFIELINYPRFSQSRYDIIYQAIELTKILLQKFKQNRISIITSDQTYLIERNDV
jgi:hypothetical protein